MHRNVYLRMNLTLFFRYSFHDLFLIIYTLFENFLESIENKILSKIPLLLKLKMTSVNLQFLKTGFFRQFSNWLLTELIIMTVYRSFLFNTLLLFPWNKTNPVFPNHQTTLFHLIRVLIVKNKNKLFTLRQHQSCYS